MALLGLFKLAVVVVTSVSAGGGRSAGAGAGGRKSADCAPCASPDVRDARRRPSVAGRLTSADDVPTKGPSKGTESKQRQKPTKSPRLFRRHPRAMATMLTLHLPGSEVSLDNPESLKIPFGVAVAVTVVLYTVGQAWGVV